MTLESAAVTELQHSKYQQNLALERWPSGRRRSPAKGVWGLIPHRGFESLSLRHLCRLGVLSLTPRQDNFIIHGFSYAPIAQLDRVPGYEPGGREFESLWAHHLFTRYSPSILYKENRAATCQYYYPSPVFSRSTAFDSPQQSVVAGVCESYLGVLFHWRLIVSYVSRQWLGIKRWKQPHTIGSYYIWFIFAQSYFPLAIKEVFLFLLLQRSSLSCSYVYFEHFRGILRQQPEKLAPKILSIKFKVRQ